MEDCGLNVAQNVTNDLRPNRLNLSKTHMDTFMSAINERINPYSTEVRKDLSYFLGPSS